MGTSLSLPTSVSWRRVDPIVSLPDDLSLLEEDDLPPLEEVPEVAVVGGGLKIHGTCAICFESGAMLSLDCEHTMCEVCVDSQLTARWPGLRLTFGYLRCGLCRAQLGHESLRDRLKTHFTLQRRVVDVAVQGFRAEGFQELCSALGRSPSVEEIEVQAEEQMAVYMCRDCNRPFCGGLATCAAALQQAESTKQPQCPDCAWRSSTVVDRRCAMHGPKFAIYKCDFCCNLAVWQCGSMSTTVSHAIQGCCQQWLNLAQEFPAAPSA